MSMKSEALRIEAARNTIRDKLVELGIASDTDNLTALATAISEIINQGAVNTTVTENGTYKIPAGYHNGLGSMIVDVASSGGGCSFSKLVFVEIMNIKETELISDTLVIE